MKLPAMDLHVHSQYSHGKGSIADIVKAGITKNLDYLAVTEHVRAQSSWFESFLSEFEGTKEEKNIKILSGIESKVLDFNGKLDATERMVQTVDLVIASVHRIPTIHQMTGDFVEEVRMDKANIADLYLRALCGITLNPDVDVIGHPFHLFKAMGVTKISRERKIEVADLLSKTKKAVEVNAFYRVPDLEFLEICLKEDVKISMGSDAHRIEDVGSVRWATRLLRKVGGTAKNMINVDDIFGNRKKRMPN